MTILAVDDENCALTFLIDRLKEAVLDAMILSADNGDDALKIAKECQIELLVTGLSLPVMEGEELAQRIHEMYPKAGILFETGETASSIKRRGIPMERVLLKPILAKDVVEKLKELPNLPLFQISVTKIEREEQVEAPQEKNQETPVTEKESWIRKISKNFKNK